jgi:hypothetical protein
VSVEQPARCCRIPSTHFLQQLLGFFLLWPQARNSQTGRPRARSAAINSRKRWNR